MYVKELTIAQGEVVGILGENGSGKTTLLKAIMGIGEIQNGEIRIDGRPVTEQYDRIAFVTEEGSYFPHLTPRQYGQFLSDFFPRFDSERYAALIQDYEIPEDRKIKTFSRGQKMKLELCAGLAKRADYLILDEPFVGKDVFTRRESLNRVVAGLTGEETVLLTTHQIDEIENVIDRAIVLHRGLVRADVYVDEVRERGLSLTDVMAEVRKTNYARPFGWPDE
nr:ABC transporter ATP-binding protein [Cohnella sp. REN36]